MVQVLPHVPQFGELLAGQLGEAAGNIGSAVAKRSILSSGLEKLKGAESPQDIASALVNLSSRIPGSERWVGPLYEQLVKQARTAPAVNIPPPGQGGLQPPGAGGQGPEGQPQAGQPSALQQYAEGSEQPAMVSGNPLLQNVAQPQTATPQTSQAPQMNTPMTPGTPVALSSLVPFDLKKYYSPDEEQKILKQVNEAGGDVEQARKNLREYNAGQITFNELQNSNVEKQSAQLQRQFALEDQLKQKLSAQIPDTTPESKKNIYYKWVSEAAADPKNRDFTSAYQQVARRIEDFGRLENAAIKSIPFESPISHIPRGFTPKQIASVGKGAKPFLEKDPLAYNILEEATVKKGNTIFDASMSFKPLNKTIKSALDSVKSERDVFGGRPLWDQTRPPPSDAHELISKLDKNWSPDISLLNVYAELAKKGWNPFQITEVLDTLADKFDSQQQVERAQLSESPRIPSRYLL